MDREGKLKAKLAEVSKERDEALADAERLEGELDAVNSVWHDCEEDLRDAHDLLGQADRALDAYGRRVPVDVFCLRRDIYRTIYADAETALCSALSRAAFDAAYPPETEKGTG